MPNARTRTPIHVLTLSLVLAAAASADTATGRFERTLEVAADVEVGLRNTNGNVTVRTWDRQAVEIVAEKRARAGDDDRAREALEQIEIAIDASDRRIEIETRLPRSSTGVLSWLFGRHVDASVSYELRVPSGAGLEVTTVNGSVSTDGPEGRQRLASTNGRISVERAGADVDASTVNGSIDLELLASAAAIEASTTNGSITLRIPADLAASLEARTVNGSVRSDLPVTVSGSNSKRRMNAELNGGGGTRIGLRTVNGSIRIRES